MIGYGRVAEVVRRHEGSEGPKNHQNLEILVSKFVPRDLEVLGFCGGSIPALPLEVPKYEV